MVQVTNIPLSILTMRAYQPSCTTIILCLYSPCQATRYMQQIYVQSRLGAFLPSIRRFNSSSMILESPTGMVHSISASMKGLSFLTRLTLVSNCQPSDQRNSVNKTHQDSICDGSHQPTLSWCYVSARRSLLTPIS